MAPDYPPNNACQLRKMLTRASSATLGGGSRFALYRAIGCREQTI